VATTEILSAARRTDIAAGETDRPVATPAETGIGTGTENGGTAIGIVTGIATGTGIGIAMTVTETGAGVKGVTVAQIGGMATRKRTTALARGGHRTACKPRAPTKRGARHDPLPSSAPSRVTTVLLAVAAGRRRPR
jgi:hypothetical protein